MEDLLPYKPSREYEAEASKTGTGILIISNKDNQIDRDLDQQTSKCSTHDQIIEERENIRLSPQSDAEITDKKSGLIFKNETLNKNGFLMEQKDNQIEIIQKLSSEKMEEEEKHGELKESIDQDEPFMQPESKKAPRYMKRQKSHHANKYHGEDNETTAGEENFESHYEENTKKPCGRRPNIKDYNELVNMIHHLSKFEWLDSNIAQKLFSSKYLTQNVVWFLICANYFPRSTFAHRNPKEACHSKLEKVKNFMPDVIERLTKTDIQTYTLPPSDLDESDLLIIDNIKKAIKTYSDTFISEDFNRNTMNSRVINAVPKTTYTLADDEWIMQTRRFLYDKLSELEQQKLLPSDEFEKISENVDLVTKVDLQDVITLYEKDLYDLILENEKLLENLESKAIHVLAEEEPINKQKFNPNSCIADIKLNFAEDEMLIDMLERKQNEGKDLSKMATADDIPLTGKSACNKPGSKFKPRIMIDDMVCQVCNDGDYTDDDLIVFCSRCNISVHQKCYGISVVPKGDWICDVCLNFGEKGKYLRCPLCDKRGGAMKPSNLRADTDLFENLNPAFHSFLKSYASEEFIKNASKIKYLNLKNLKDVVKNHDAHKDDETKASNNGSETDFSENLYYDIQFLDDNFTEEELANEPKPAYVWVHMTCVVFIPELYFGDQSLLTNILGMENINKDRFKYECQVCGKKRSGSIINCGKGNCKKAFHPECARRGKYFLDIKENECYQLVYHIFCDKHMPLKLRRTLESREKKMKEEINKFFKMVEKYCIAPQTSSQQNGSTDQNLFVDLEKRARKYEKKEDGHEYLSLIEKYKEITAQKPCSITLEKMGSDESGDLYEIINISLSKQNLTKDRKLTADDEIWTVLPYKDLTPEQKYKKYRKILAKLKKKRRTKELKMEIYRRNMERAREIKNKIAQKAKLEEGQNQISVNQAKAKNTSKDAKKDKENQGKENVNSAEKLYCICKKKYHGELMICCDGCEEWFHPMCVGIPKLYDLKKIRWWCRKCSRKKGFKDADYLIGDKIGKREIFVKKRVNSDKLEEEEPPLVKKRKLNNTGKGKSQKKM